jgi:hypothetical protein
MSGWRSEIRRRREYGDNDADCLRWLLAALSAVTVAVIELIALGAVMLVFATILRFLGII